MKNQILIIGCGYWGSIIINTIKNLKKFKKIYVCDVDNRKTNLIKKRFGDFVNIIKLDKISKYEDIRYIYLATPPSKNLKLIKKLIPLNKKILLEKPGFSNLKDFRIVKKQLNKSKSELRFGYIYLYHQYINYLKNIIKNNKLGKIKYIKFQRQNFGPIRNDVNAFADLATHDLSILKFLFNNEIKLKNYIKHDILRLNSGDIISANFTIKKIPIDINVSWLNPEKVRKITIITNKKMILFDEMNIAKPIQIYDNYANYPKISKFTDDYFSQKAFVYKGKSRYIKLKDKMSLDQEILDFVNDKKNISDIDFASDIIKISNKIIN
jgi:predicted dehydrogenase